MFFLNALKNLIRSGIIRVNFEKFLILVLTIAIIFLFIFSLIYLDTVVSQRTFLKVGSPEIRIDAKIEKENDSYILYLNLTNLARIDYLITKAFLIDHYNNISIININVELQPGENINFTTKIEERLCFLKNKKYYIVVLTKRGIVYAPLIIQ